MFSNHLIGSVVRLLRENVMDLLESFLLLLSLMVEMNGGTGLFGDYLCSGCLKNRDPSDFES